MGNQHGSHEEDIGDKDVEEKDISPYKTRKLLIKDIQQCLANSRLQTALTYLIQLRKTLGLEEEGEKLRCPEMCFVLDDSGVEQVVKLTKLLRMQPAGWRDDVEMVCHRLLAHYGPPCNIAPQQIPQHDTHGVVDLNLMGIDISRKNRIHTVKDIISKNRNLRSMELSFTGLDDNSLLVLIPPLAELEDLANLGLRGNKLRNISIENLSKGMEEPESFPSLLWVDLQNNKDIFVLPEKFLKLLKSRWPDEGYRPSLRALADDYMARGSQIMVIETD